MNKAFALRELGLLTIFAICLSPQSGLASQTPQDVANLVLEQVKDGLPALLKGPNLLSDAANVPILQDSQSISFDSLDDLPQKMPYPPDQALLQQLTSDFGDSNIGNEPMSWSPEANLGGVVVSEGDDECDYWNLFSAADGHTHLIATPAVLGQMLCDESGESGALSHVGAYGVATSVTSPEDDFDNGGSGSSAVLTIAVQVWDGQTWTPPAQLQAVLAYPLDPKPFYKYCASGNCADAEKLAFRMAERLESSSEATFKPFRLSSADAKKYAAMVDNSKDGSEDSLPGPLVTDDSADTSGPDSGDWSFGDASTLFAAYLDGALVLGRIGHGQLAWREDPDWNIAFWSLDDDGTDLDPVAGFIFQHAGPYLKLVTIGGHWTPNDD